MKAAGFFLEMILHAHVIVGANSILQNEQIPLVQDIARKIMKSSVKIKFDEAGNDIMDGVHLYASDLLTLNFSYLFLGY